MQCNIAQLFLFSYKSFLLCILIFETDQMMISNTIRAHALEIFYAGLRAIEADTCVRRYIHIDGSILRIGGKTYNLDKFNGIYVVEFGKASSYMFATLEILPADTDGNTASKKGDCKALSVFLFFSQQSELDIEGDIVWGWVIGKDSSFAFTLYGTNYLTIGVGYICGGVFKGMEWDYPRRDDCR